ncbi:MAG TPA: hypothetical protein VF469_08105 [Kofleriaceae bacterium]
MRSCLALLALLAACSSSTPPADAEPPLTGATSLKCPAPGALPFRLASSGFQRAANKTTASDDPTSKDEASDTIGNPGGKLASVYLADDQSPSTAPIGYHGVKARAMPTNGIVAAALPGEHVSLWFYDATKAAWQSLGRATTDDSGAYDLDATGLIAPNGQPVYAMLEADGSCAAHFDYLLAPGSKVVVTDIDGTLTLSDAELINQLSAEATYVPKRMGAADQLTQAWAAKGYPVVYLTARPHKYRAETRGWLAGQGFASGPLITEGSTATADVYKTLWLSRMIQDLGWNVVAAYGNAPTDVTAYKNAGIPPGQTFIIGGLTDVGSDVVIPNNDFSQHITSYVMAQPANQ